MSETIRRPFATGSKPGPDAVDHYLETQGYYRKHVARDASSLFRVVSEQIFDIQNYHEKVRQGCADFLESNSKEYSNEVDKNLYNYISNLRKARTHGSLLELRVLARKYRKNVVLFEPTQNLQTTSLVYVQNDEYNSSEPMRVFYSHKDKHFDVIYTMENVERLAECQAIVYTLLYSNVYRLPDVPYAVERMLHDQEEQVTLPMPEDPSKYVTQSGDVIDFDSHISTNCVLKDPKTCHFHNQTNFDEIVNENKDAITVINRTDEPGRLKIFKPIDGFLHDKEKSCVRQLLDERITPFPYKVAKALDPSIYRNTEFELWSENRKEQRLKWLDSEFPLKQHLDDKWFVYDRRGMRKFYDGKYEQGVVDESAYMALDEETKKKYVVLDPAAEPFKLHHFTGLNHFVPAKESVELTVMPANVYNRGGNFKGNKRGGGGRYNNNSNYRDGNFHHYANRPPHHHAAPMPHVSEIEGRDGSFSASDQDTSQNYYQPAQQPETEDFESQPVQQTPSNPNFQTFQPAQAQPVAWPKQMVQMSPYPPQGQPVHFMPPPMGYQQVMPYGNFSIPPPPPELQFQQPSQVSEPHSVGDNGDCMNLIRETELSSTLINWKPKESADPNGSDLPLSDLHSLQFYYNLGVRYYLASGVQRRLETVASQLENLEIHESTSEKVCDKSDPPPVPTNTPVTTKSSFGPPGHRYQQSINIPHSGGFRRGNGNFRENYRGGWNNSNNNSGHRKDFKFNSNVKNVHKNDQKGSSTATQTFGRAKTTNEATTPKLHHEKSSPNSTTQFSPISPIAMEAPYPPQQQVEYQQVPAQQQFFAQYPQTFMPPQQPPPGVGLIYHVNEDGQYTMVQQIAAPQYQYPPYQGQPQTPHFQHNPFQAQPFNPQTPVFYPAAIPNFQQPQTQQQVMDGSVVSNDSGMVEFNNQSYQAPPPPMPYYPQYAPQVFYAPPPMPQTPQIAQTFPTQITPQISHEPAQAPAASTQTEGNDHSDNASSA